MEGNILLVAVSHTLVTWHDRPACGAALCSSFLCVVCMVGRLRAWEGRQALQDPLPDAAAFPSRIACGGSAVDSAALPGRRCMSARVINHTE